MLVDPIYLSLFLRKDQKLQMLCFDRRSRRKKKGALTKLWLTRTEQTNKLKVTNNQKQQKHRFTKVGSEDLTQQT